MDAVLPGPSSPPSNPPVIAATPRRHLKTLSLASTTALGDGSPGSPASLISRASASALGASSPLSPAGRSSRSPNPRPPLSPSPAVARKGSLARGPRRTSSISYSPSARLEGSGGLSADGRPALLSPSHGRRPASPSQLRPASATWLGDLAEGDDSSTDGQDGLVAVSPGASATAPPSSSLHSHARWGSRTNSNASGGDVERSALTLAERHGSLLSLIAQKEARSLELREQLASNEAELANLKRNWTAIVSQASSRAPAMPSLSPSAFSLGQGPSSEGLISQETLQSGKRLLNLVLGVSDEDAEPQPDQVNHNSAAVPPRAPGRSSLDMLTSAARSSLEAVSEAFEPLAPLARQTAPSPASPSADSRASPAQPSCRRSSRLSLSSSISSQTEPDADQRSSHGSFDSTTSAASSFFSPTPTADKSYSKPSTPMGPHNMGKDPASSKGAAVREKDTSALFEDLSSSSSSSLSTTTGSWGKSWGDFATGLGGSASFRSSKRATLSLTSSLTSHLASSLRSLELPTSSSSPSSTHPLSAPSSTFKTSSRPLPNAVKMAPISPASCPASRSPSLVDLENEAYFGSLGVGELQEPLTPVGRSPVPRIGQRVTTQASGSERASTTAIAADETDAWNW